MTFDSTTLCASSNLNAESRDCVEHRRRFSARRCECVLRGRRVWSRFGTTAAHSTARCQGRPPGCRCTPSNDRIELRLLLEDARSEGSIESAEAEIVARTFEFPGKSVRDAMVPRSDVHSVSAAASLEEVMSLVRQTGHTRFPVFLEEPGELYGRRPRSGHASCRAACARRQGQGRDGDRSSCRIRSRSTGCCVG